MGSSDHGVWEPTIPNPPFRRVQFFSRLQPRQNRYCHRDGGQKIQRSSHRRYRGRLTRERIFRRYSGRRHRTDAATGQSTRYPTPTPDSGPRRTFLDAQDQYWFGENYANKIGMCDTSTRLFKEWTPPVQWNGAYPVVRDKNGDVWTVGMTTDYVFRLNPQTDSFVE